MSQEKLSLTESTKDELEEEQRDSKSAATNDPKSKTPVTKETVTTDTKVEDVSATSSKSENTEKATLKEELESSPSLYQKFVRSLDSVLSNLVEGNFDIKSIN